MIGSIVVPLDRSAFAESALPLAAAVAQRTGAELHLVHVYAGTLPGGADDTARELHRELRGYLEELTQRVADASGLTVHHELLLHSRVHIAVAEYIRRRDIDMLAVSTHGYGGLRRAWLGSETDALLRQVDVPLLLIRPEAETGGVEIGSQASPTHVLIACDGSAIAERALDAAATLSSAMGARCTLLRVVPPPVTRLYPYVPPREEETRAEVERRRAEAAEYLAPLAQRWRDRGLDVDEKVGVHPRPADAILGAASQLGVDLIALGIRGRDPVRRMILGSVADKVIRGASTPVFVQPARAAERLPSSDSEATSPAR